MPSFDFVAILRELVEHQVDFIVVGGRTAVLLGVGVLLGGGASLVTGQLFAAILYDVSPRDPVTFAAVVTLTALTALVAGAIPARRAMAIDPSVSLREE